MTAAFPATGAPVWYGQVFTDRQFGVHYVGESVYLTITTANVDATTYTVINRHGTTVTSGTLGSTTSVGGGQYTVNTALAPPVGGWQPGWYRCNLTGSHTDGTWGTNMGSANIVIFRDHAGFVTIPAAYNTIYGNQANSPLWHGICGVGPTRMNIKNANDPTHADANGTDVDNLANMVALANYATAYKPSDTVRPWNQWCAFNNGTTDRYDVLQGSGVLWAAFMPKTGALDGANIFVEAVSGSVSGVKINVYFPNSTTLVESYDNLSDPVAGPATINAASNYVYVAGYQGTPATKAKAAIGNAYRTGVALTVSTLYPLGVTHYEGPVNEPNPLSSYISHLFMLFQAAVHLGHADAKAIGPTPVAITDLDAFRVYLQGLEDIACVPDGLAVHAYNSGDRYQIERFIAMLGEFDLEDIELWQTESTSASTSEFGVYKQNASQNVIAGVLLWEQYGVPRERTPYWYDWTHGFWGVPNFAIMGNGGLHAFSVYYRVLAEETFGMPFHHRVDFGSEAANSLFFGSLYAQPPEVGLESVAVLMTTCYMAGSPTVTLDVAGTTSPLTVVDAAGVEATVTITAGQAVIPVDEFPTYVQLPAGVSVTVAETSLLGPTVAPSLSAAAAEMTIGGANARVIGDNAPLLQYAAYPGGKGIAYSLASLPDSGELHFDDDTVVKAIVVHVAGYHQQMSVITAGKIQYLDTDDTTWLDAATISQTLTSVLNSNSSVESGCTRETYARPQTKHAHKFTVPVTTKAVRVYVTALSYGGQPDTASFAASIDPNSGMNPPKLALVEIMVLSDSTPALTLDPYDEEVLADSPNFYFPDDTGSGSMISAVNSPAMNATFNGSPARGVEGLTTEGSRGTRFSPGSGQSYQVADGALTDVGDNCTVECWFSPTTLAAGSQAIMGKGSTGGTPGLSFDSLHGTVAFAKSGAGAVTAVTTLGAGGTYHIVGTKNGAAWKIYINGELDATGATSGFTFANNSSAFYIGDDGSGGNGTCGGIVHKPALYPTALSAARVRAHYLAGLAAITPECILDPEVVGEPNVGQQVATVNGFFSGFPTKYVHVWERSTNGTTGWAAISGATKAEYLLQGADGAKYVRRGTVASNTAGATSTVFTPAFGPIEAEIETGVPFTRPFGNPSLIALGIVFTPTSGAT